MKFSQNRHDSPLKNLERKGGMKLCVVFEITVAFSKNDLRVRPTTIGTPYFCLFSVNLQMKQPHGRMSTKWAPHHVGGASNVTGASQGVSPLPNLHNLQLIT